MEFRKQAHAGRPQGGGTVNPVLPDQTFHCLDATVITTLVAIDPGTKTCHARAAASFAAAHPVSIPKGEQLRTSRPGIWRRGLGNGLCSDRDDDPERRRKADDTDHRFASPFERPGSTSRRITSVRVIGCSLAAPHASIASILDHIPAPRVQATIGRCSPHRAWQWRAGVAHGGRRWVWRPFLKGHAVGVHN